MFESMFAGVADDALVGTIEDLRRQEAVIAARRLAAIAELVHRTVDEDDERGRWAFDPWDGTAARVGAALNIGHRRASGQMHQAVALRDRLPAVAELFRRGDIDARLVSQLTWRTNLIDSDELIAVVDTQLAAAAARFGPLSQTKLQTAIDAVIAAHDPDAVRRSRDRLRTRELNIGACDDADEVTAIWGRLSATDAAVLDRKVTAMTRQVCDADPRSSGERRADALGALANDNDRLVCRCGDPHCPSAGEQPSSNVVIRVIADRAAVDDARAVIAAEKDAPAVRRRGTALLAGKGALPAVALAEAIRGGATIAPLAPPGTEAEPGYRPSTRLAEFIRARDLFCRFPGCDVPAERCDIDHVTPWPAGPTHPSNLHCKCRTHHLMKTFYGGPGGWRDVQCPDGTVIWTAPDGRSYMTRPGSRLYFPAWDITSADLPRPSANAPPGPGRTAMMPRRQRTRAAEAAARVRAERELNRGQHPFSE
ncbi:MAG: DUF222 domain-containing protein [Actinomycetota bacterium]|nr:DUF222 domain-containing protein [Actinomycetota bacterium]